MKNEFSFLFFGFSILHSVVFLCRFGDVITIIWRRQQQKLKSSRKTGGAGLVALNIWPCGFVTFLTGRISEMSDGHFKLIHLLKLSKNIHVWKKEKKKKR